LSLLPKDVLCNPGREEKSGRFTETEKHAAPPDSLRFQRLTTQKRAADFSAAQRHSQNSLPSWPDTICQSLPEPSSGHFKKRTAFPREQHTLSQAARRTAPSFSRDFCDWGRYFLQLSLTILTLVTLRWPCSVASLSMPCSFISSLTFSLAPCMSAFRTLPVTVTVWPA
jgi:hypothetical protein